MPAVHLIDAEGRRRTLQLPAGRNLMRCATDAGVAEIAADCGGTLSCATCHVYVAPEWASKLRPPTHEEESMLEMTAAERRPTSRLSCQIDVDAELDGLIVELPPTQY